MLELLDLYDQYRRGQREPPEITDLIESEGGQVLEQRRISRLVPSPFQGLRLYPLLYEFRVRYQNRSGHWYVRSAKDNGGLEWAWLDAEGYESLPIPNRGAVTARDLQAVGLAKDSVFVFGMIAIGLVICIAVYLAFF